MILEELKVLIEGDASGLTSALGKLGLTIGAGALFHSIIENSIEAQDAMAQLEARVESTGGVAGKTVDELDALSMALARQTTFGDEAVKSAESMLLTFTKIRGGVFDQATETVLDLATAMGGDLQGAAIQVGKALNDPVLGITALTRVGVTFSAEQKKVIKNLVETGHTADAQKLILQELQTEFGGAATAARDTLGGALAALGNAWGDQLEVSRASSSGVIDAIEGVTAALPMLRDAVDFVIKGWASLGVHAALAVEQLELAARAIDPRRLWSDDAQAAFEEQKRTVEQMTAAAEEMMAALADGEPAASKATKTITQNLEETSEAARKAAKHFADLLRGHGEIETSDPFGTARAEREAKKIADIVATARGQRGAAELGPIIQLPPIEQVTRMVTEMDTWHTKNAVVIEDTELMDTALAGLAATGLDSIIDFATGATDSFHEFIENAIHDIERLLIKLAIVEGLKAAFSGATGGFGKFMLDALEHRATGGPVLAGRPYLVGERGPELFVPSASGGIVPNGGGGGMSAAALLAALGPLPRPQTPREVSRDVWYRDLIRHALADHEERG